MTTSKQPTCVADRSYTVVTCDFGDPFWITHSLSQLDRCSDGRVASIVVVDQTRSSAAVLARLPRLNPAVGRETFRLRASPGSPSRSCCC